MPNAKGRVVTESERHFLSASRMASGLKQKQLAQLADVTQAWLSRLLTGARTDCRQDMIARVARVLAETLEKSGQEESCSKSAYLREVFLGEAVSRPGDEAIGKLAMVGLVSSGLGISENDAETLWRDTRLLLRIEGAIRVLRSAKVICGGRTTTEGSSPSAALVLAVMICGLPVSEEAIVGLLADSTGIDQAIAALEGVAKVIGIVRESKAKQ